MTTVMAKLHCCSREHISAGAWSSSEAADPKFKRSSWLVLPFLLRGLCLAAATFDFSLRGTSVLEPGQDGI